MMDGKKTLGTLETASLKLTNKIVTFESIFILFFKFINVTPEVNLSSLCLCLLSLSSSVTTTTELQ